MSNKVVVDTSIVIKWVIDETGSNIAVALLARWISEGLIILAPSLLAYEITNVLH
jgi:predicted nucleic acid-binding protein